MQISLFKMSNFITSVPWLKGGIVLIVLGLSVISYQITQQLPWFYIVGGISVIIAALLSLRYMTLALTSVIATSAIIGVTIDTGRQTPLSLSFLAIGGLIAVWLLRMAIFERKVSIKASPLNFPIMAFLLVAILSTLYGNTNWAWTLPAPNPNRWVVQIGQFSLFLFSFGTTYLVAHHSPNEKTLKTWSGIIILLGFVRIIDEFIKLDLGLADRGASGALLMWPVVLLAAQLLFNPYLSNRIRLIFIFGLIIWLAWAYQIRDWKSGWVPALVGLCLLLFFKDWRIFLFVALLAFLIIINLQDLIEQEFLLDEYQTASTVRPLFWKDIIRMTKGSPLLGLGLVNYMYYWYDPAFIPESRIAAGWHRWDLWGYAPPSHNMFVDIYAQTGLLGSFFFIWSISAALYLVYKTSQRFPPGFLRAYTISVLCGFFAILFGSFLLADWLIPFVYNITITGFRHSVYSWLLLGSVLGLYFKMRADPGWPASEDLLRPPA
jgi:hypothetical protein